MIMEPFTTSNIKDLLDLGVRFGCVYADPPWRYGNQSTRASTSNHYKGDMSIDEIKNMPIASLIADNAHLHLWTTNAFLFDCKSIMEAWGFTYKSCFVWVKPQMGIGNYWRLSHEFLLFGLRGKSPFRSHNEKSWGQFDRNQHSAKPEEIRHKIEKISPGPYLELFGRRPVINWHVFGNQIESDLLSGI